MASINSLPRFPSYVGTTANGIQTRPYGEYDGARITCGLTVVNVSGTFLFRDYYPKVYQAHMAMFNQAINENTTIGGLTTAKRNRARQWPPTCTGQPPD